MTWPGACGLLGLFGVVHPQGSLLLKEKLMLKPDFSRSCG